MPAHATALYLFSDRHRCADWRAALHRAGPHCHLILRDYDAPDRDALAAAMAAFCRTEARGFAIAGDRALARKHRAAFHCPSHLLTRVMRHPHATRQAQPPRQAHPDSHDSAAVHNPAELHAAAQAGFGRVFISPVFATNSHPGGRGLGVMRARQLARMARALGLSPLALGGMDAARMRRLNGGAEGAKKLFTGYGAITAFAP